MSDEEREVLKGISDNDSPTGDTKEDSTLKIPLKPLILSSLPPVDRNHPPQINISKKRRLILSPGKDDELETKIPLKLMKGNTSKRTMSLTEVYNPNLTPPRSGATYKTIDSPEGSPLSLSTPLSTPRSVSEPSIAELKRIDTRLDSEIRRARAKLESLKRAKQILQNNDTEKNTVLIDKWRTAAQKASNYLLNAAIDKVNKAGGKQEFVRKEREREKEALEHSIDNSFQDRVYDISHSEEFQELPEAEQESIIVDLEREQEKALEEAEKTFIEKNDDEVDEEFTMKDLYKRLKINYKLVFPNND